MFSRFAVALRQKSAITIPELIEVLRDAYTPKPICQVVNNVGDFKSWCDTKALKKLTVSKVTDNESLCSLELCI